MKKLLCVLLIVVALSTLVACKGLFSSHNSGENNENTNQEYIIKVVEGYVVVNGVKTDVKANPQDVVEVIDGYVVVNGVKTEYKVGVCDHVWHTVTTAPTCSIGGYDTHTCSLCGKIVKDNETPKLTHAYSSYYSFDTNFHWFGCTGCSKIKDKAAHIPDASYNCIVCAAPLCATPGVIYAVSNDGNYAEVVGYTGTSSQVKIAEEYDGMPVEAIAGDVFKNNTKVTSIIIPDSVKSIGERAFAYCTNLSSIVLGEGVTSIAAHAFAYCTNLEAVVMGDNVVSIGNYAFYCCSELKTIVISEGVLEIGSNAFDGCHSILYAEYEFGKYVGNGDNPYAILVEINDKEISEYIINDSTKYIAYGAFQYCSSLASIIIPDSVISISSCAFRGCTSLNSVEIGDGVTSIGPSSFYNCYSLGYLVLGNNVSSIGGDAFYECCGLSYVAIPESVISIGDRAFNGCYILNSVVIGNNVRSIGSMAFYGCTGLKDVYYTGSSSEWSRIYIDSSNDCLTSATLHYNYVK